MAGRGMDWATLPSWHPAVIAAHRGAESKSPTPPLSAKPDRWHHWSFDQHLSTREPTLTATCHVYAAFISVSWAFDGCEQAAGDCSTLAMVMLIYAPSHAHRSLFAQTPTLAAADGAEVAVIPLSENFEKMLFQPPHITIEKAPSFMPAALQSSRRQIPRPATLKRSDQR